MKSVLIADDEIHVRSLLKHLIHWDEFELILKGEFDNAEDVVSFVKQEKVDIIITDIMMPGMNGIEMIKTVKEIQNQCRFILISGYRDFEFAQAAVKLGVSDYILKPLNEEEVNTVLKTLASEKDENQEELYKKTVLRQNFREILEGERKLDDLGMAEEKYGMHFEKEGVFRVLLLGFCSCSEEENIEKCAGEILQVLKKSIREFCTEQETFQVSRLRYNVVIQIRKGMEVQVLRTLDTTYRELSKEDRSFTAANFYLAVGKAVDDINEIKSSAQSAAFFLSGRLVWGKQRVYVADILPQADRLLGESIQIEPAVIRRFERSVEAIDEAGIKSVIRQVFEEYQKQSEQNFMLYFYMVYELGNHLALVLNRLNIHPRETKELQARLEKLTENCDTIQTLRSAAEKFCIDTMNKYLADKKDHGLSYVHFAREYIEQHYAEEITLNLIAEKAHVNPAYLSTIFKENTGVNYSAYLTSVRVERAKRLLEQLDMNLSQIANAVGYSSTRYFSRTFEQETGMKPSEYRRIYLRELRG